MQLPALHRSPKNLPRDLENQALLNRLCLLLVLLIMTAWPCFAAPSDIVPPGAAVNDWMAAMAARGYLGRGVHASDFTSEALHTRDQLAHMLAACLIDSDELDAIQKDGSTEPLVYESVRYFRDELLAMNVDVDSLLDNLRSRSVGYVGTIQPEERIGAGENTPDGTDVIYRAVAGSELADHYTWVGSASNWWQDWRRNFYNDIGPEGFTGFNEGYLRYDGPRGLDIRAGQMFERWGPAMRGAELISDNVPPFDEVRVSFPFSLGVRFGENYRYTQFISSFQDYAGPRYFEGRRIEYAFSSRWNAQYEEAFKSNFEGTLYSTPLIPFQLYKNFTNINFSEPLVKYDYDFGLTYSASANTRFYGQYVINDYRSPTSGNFLGVSLGYPGTVIQRRIGYMLGGTVDAGHGTSATLEYVHSDATLEIFQNDNAGWNVGRYDYIGMPTGANVSEISGRIGQRIGERVNVAVDYRDRGLFNRSYPAPTSRELGLYGYYSLDARSTFGLAYHDYRQDAFTGPLVGYIDTTSKPLNEADFGQTIRERELDVSYAFTF